MKNITLDDIIIGKTNPDSNYDFEYDEILDYTFPTMDTVPPGVYLGIINAAKASTTSKNEPCFDIYYKLLRDTEFLRYHRGYIDTVKYQRIKMRFKKNSSAANKFISDMRRIGLPEKFNYADLIDTEVVVSMEYRNDNSLGSFGYQKAPSKDYGDWFDIEETEDENSY